MEILVFLFAEALRNHYSFRAFLRKPFTKATLSTAPKGSFWSGVGDGSKGQIL
jgi:hypothetical protein